MRLRAGIQLHYIGRILEESLPDRPVYSLPIVLVKEVYPVRIYTAVCLPKHARIY